ncbi:MAG TPA: DUF4173 domain-containing protein, partial [Pseudoneobacillus sp.]|nr:DUF4173 domain-containing protein [Pseudoneobacillus sp.]
MDLKGLKQKDFIFFLACLCLAIGAQQMLETFYGGISLFIFLASFYMVFYLRFKKWSFSNHRIGLLLFICTWVFASTFILRSSLFFLFINTLLLPFFIVAQLLLVTSKAKTVWFHWSFLLLFFRTIGAMFNYIKTMLFSFLSKFKRGVNERTIQVIKKIFIGLLISGPILFFVLILLTSADLEFRRIVLLIPSELFQFQLGNGLIRFVIISILTFILFSFMQVLYYRAVPLEQKIQPQRSFSWDNIIIWTLLISLNLVYLLFTIIQFRYLFTDRLLNGFTYAEYARRGFFELLIVTILNLSILVIVVTFMKHQSIWSKQMNQVLLTLLVVFTKVMLISAFLRLMMYEDAYGYTFSRVLAHSFMLYLLLLLIYTFLKIWIDRLSIIHFYLLSGIIFYTGLNVINLEQLVVNENLERYEKTGKVDIDYLNSMSYTGWSGLMDLYQKKS